MLKITEKLTSKDNTKGIDCKIIAASDEDALHAIPLLTQSIEIVFNFQDIINRVDMAQCLLRCKNRNKFIGLSGKENKRIRNKIRKYTRHHKKMRGVVDRWERKYMHQ